MRKFTAILGMMVVCSVAAVPQTIEDEICSTMLNNQIISYDMVDADTDKSIRAGDPLPLSDDTFDFQALLMDNISGATTLQFSGTVTLDNYILIFTTSDGKTAKLAFEQPVEYARGSNIRFELKTIEDNTKNQWFKSQKGWYLGFTNGNADSYTDGIPCVQLNKMYYAANNLKIYTKPSAGAENYTGAVWKAEDDGYINSYSKNEFTVNGKKGRWYNFTFQAPIKDQWVFVSDGDILTWDEYKKMKDDNVSFPLAKISVGDLMNASENLRLRSQEATSSIIITTMEKGTSVKIVKVGKAETIDGITSNWVQVEVQLNAKDRNGKTIPPGTNGWCYGGYLE